MDATDPDADRATRLEISLTQVLGGALAAVTSAVAASTLGIAGTLVGAAAGSVIGTVGGAVYTHSLRRTRHTVRLRRPDGTLVTEPAAGTAALPAADTVALPTDAAVGTDPEPSRSSPGSAQRRFARPWTVAAASAAALALGLGGLTVGELVAGRPAASVVSGSDGSGTTLGSSLPGSSDATPTTPSGAEPDTAAPTETAGPSEPTPTPTPTPAGPTATPTPTPTPAEQPAAPGASATPAPAG